MPAAPVPNNFPHNPKGVIHAAFAAAGMAPFTAVGPDGRYYGHDRYPHNWRGMIQAILDTGGGGGTAITNAVTQVANPSVLPAAPTPGSTFWVHNTVPTPGNPQGTPLNQLAVYTPGVPANGPNQPAGYTFLDLLNGPFTFQATPPANLAQAAAPGALHVVTTPGKEALYVNTGSQWQLATAAHEVFPWSATESYITGNIVEHNGRLYIAGSDTSYVRPPAPGGIAQLGQVSGGAITRYNGPEAGAQQSFENWYRSVRNQGDIWAYITAGATQPVNTPLLAAPIQPGEYLLWMGTPLGTTGAVNTGRMDGPVFVMGISGSNIGFSSADLDVVDQLVQAATQVAVGQEPGTAAGRGWHALEPENWVKGDHTAADQGAPAVNGDLQITLEKDHHELKILEQGSWQTVFNEADLSKTELFRGNVSDGARGNPDLSTLPDILANSDDRSLIDHYWIWEGDLWNENSYTANNYMIPNAGIANGISRDLGGIYPQTGDVIIIRNTGSDGAPVLSYVMQPGLLTHWLPERSYPAGSIVRHPAGDGNGNVSSSGGSTSQHIFKATQEIPAGTPDSGPHQWISEVYTVELANVPAAGTTITMSIGGSSIRYTVVAGETANSLQGHLIKEINHDAYMDHVRAVAGPAINGNPSISLIGTTAKPFNSPVVLPPPLRLDLVVSATPQRNARASLWEDVTPVAKLETLADVDHFDRNHHDGDILVYSSRASAWKIRSGPSIYPWEVQPYSTGDLVTFGGLIWRARQDITLADEYEQPGYIWRYLITIPDGDYPAARNMFRFDYQLGRKTSALAVGPTTTMTADKHANAAHVAADLETSWTADADFQRKFAVSRQDNVLTLTAKAARPKPLTLSFADPPALTGGGATPAVIDNLRSNSSFWELVSPETIGDLFDVDDLDRADGDTIIYDAATQTYRSGSYTSPVTYYGEGPLDVANAGNTPRYGTPVNTVPDVLFYPPSPGDTYINVLDGKISHWIGPGGVAYSDQPRNTHSMQYTVTLGATPAPPDFKLAAGPNVLTQAEYDALSPVDGTELYRIVEPRKGQIVRLMAGLYEVWKHPIPFFTIHSDDHNIWQRMQDFDADLNGNPPASPAALLTIDVPYDQDLNFDFHDHASDIDLLGTYYNIDHLWVGPKSDSTSAAVGTNDPSERSAIGGAVDYLQTRYGGIWLLPKMNKGDELSLFAGYGAGKHSIDPALELAVIRFI